MSANLPRRFLARTARTTPIPDRRRQAAGGDTYGGFLQLHLSPQWVWDSEYSWSYNNADVRNASSQIQFGRAWRTGLMGSHWNTQFSFAYRDVGPEFASPANPALSRMS